MSLSDDKKQVFNKIGSYTSMMQSIDKTNSTNIFPSINNKKDIVPFLLDTLKVIVGTAALQELTGELLTKFIDGIEPKMKDALKKQATQYNSGDDVPTSFTETGYRVPVKNIDVYGKYKTNPDSKSGNLIYDKTKVNFDNQAYNSIKNESTTSIGGLNMTYSPLTDEMVFKGDPTTTIGTWTNNYIDSLVIIDKKEFISNVMNRIYGTITNSQNKTVDEVYQELIVDKLIQQLIDDDNDTFELSPNDYEELLAKANEMINGVVNYNMGCGLYGAKLSLDDLSGIISNVSGSTDSFYVGNQINNSIDKSISDQAVADENKESIKDGFFQRIIQYVTQTLAKSLTTSPQVRTLLAVTSAMQNNGQVLISSAKDDLKKFKTFIKCNVKQIVAMISEYIFNLVKKMLILLLVPVIKLILKEKINQYKKILMSLLPIKTVKAVSTG